MADREELIQAVRYALEIADELGEVPAGCHLSTALQALESRSAHLSTPSGVSVIVLPETQAATPSQRMTKR